MNELVNYIFSSLDDDFEFEKKLSQNAISELSLYKHKETKQSILLLKTFNRNDDVFRKLNTVDMHGYLQQIHIVASDDEALYVLEEYIEGTAANEYIGDSDLNQNDVIRWSVDICNALEILHNNNIIHRDIKPANVIVKSDGHATLIDLSIATLLSVQKDNDTQNLGTIGYAAPEQFGLSQSRPETDIYALGIMMNIMLTGVHPTIEIPKGKIGKIIKKCTAISIGDRYKNIEELKKDLEKIK